MSVHAAATGEEVPPPSATAASEDSAHVGAIGSALEPLTASVATPTGCERSLMTAPSKSSCFSTSDVENVLLGEDPLRRGTSLSGPDPSRSDGAKIDPKEAPT